MALFNPVLFISSIPPVTRIFTAATIAGTVVYTWLHWTGVESTPYLVMVPGACLWNPWTFFTSALVETSIIEFLVTILFVPASLKYLERIWGPVETAKFILVTIVVPNIIAFGLNWIEFIGTRNAELFLYGMQYHGQMALQTALLVAFTQLIPEHQVQILGLITTRVKNLPMAYLTLSTVLCIVGFQCPWIIIQFGWFVGWIYLRFYKKNHGEATGGVVTYGDRSETFSLLSWFPPLVHYPIGLLGNFVFSIATKLRLLPASIPGDLESGMYAPVNTRAEAERRRALALKALDQRLANPSSPSPSTSNQTIRTPHVESGSPSPTNDMVRDTASEADVAGGAKDEA
ncbi:DUF1751-domain-containing protein [Fistulina hepatica ATCC 64428]|uniref:DUF1751-domain-containing protein n=1 Tax=Fistulina hepatica ATCC 64428 TaxID=1128425 RepID=A0A0D7AHF2_9AGAR|nr:DUF1751-domain-containing protein [Fistulina hepatica ATCC 64428]